MLMVLRLRPAVLLQANTPVEEHVSRQQEDQPIPIPEAIYSGSTAIVKVPRGFKGAGKTCKTAGIF